MQLIDQYQRKINYLRISVTDHCNYNCIYCKPTQKADFLPRQEMLSFEEIERIVKIGTQVGINKVRITGGEPLLRRNLVELVRNLANVNGIDDLCLTTSGQHLNELALLLKQAGLMRINLSLDSLQPECYRTITGGGNLSAIWRGIEALETAGFNPVKLNVVVMRGINEDEIGDFVSLAQAHPWQIRFIELRPNNPLYKQAYLPIRTIWQRINREFLLKRINSSPDSTAKLYTFDQAKGCLGFIGRAEEVLCSTCNRLRLNAAGKLYPCLFSPQPLNLKELLRRQASDDELLAFFRQAALHKPAHLPDNNLSGKTLPMYKIGG
ncbi:MAG: GTP 3',8-cyclase MoaA [Candidatus Schekmanbacteria bacterium]|nr:GTP 3',8-cyclase MoaA [Candidatus Schekmanbacteria bacterium]